MKNNVITNSVIYTICGLLLKCFSFFLLPLYTSYLTTEDYGITTICTSFTTVMGFIVSFSLYSAIMRFYVDYKDDEEKLKEFYGTTISFIFISGLVFTALLIGLNKVLTKYIFVGIDFFPIVFICVLNLFFSSLYSVYGRILQSQQKALKCSVVTVIYFLSHAFLNIMFVAVLKLGALGVLLSNVSINCIFCFYFIVEMLLKKQIKFTLNRQILKESLRYSVPIMPHNLSTHVAEFLSKVLIGNTSALAELGVYSIAAQFGTISDTVQSYVNSAYGPWLYEKLHSDKSDSSGLGSVVEVLCFAIGFFLLGICLFAQDYIYLFINSSYHDAFKYIPLIVFVYLIKIPYYFYINILFYYKDASKRIFIATLSGSLINVFLSAFLIPRYGAYGSIFADAIAMFIRVSIVVYISKNYGSRGFSGWIFIKVALWVVCFVAMGLMPYVIFSLNRFSGLYFVYKVGIVLLYLVAVFVTHRKSINMVLKKGV